MFYFRSPPKAAPKIQPVQTAIDDIEIATQPRRGVARQTSSRDDTALHQRRQQNHAPSLLEHQDHSNSSISNSSLNSNSASNHLHVHHATAPVSAGILFQQPQHSNKGSQGSLTIPSKVSGLSAQQPQQADAVLLHPIFLKIPLQFRFGFVGLLSNILFMIVYNLAVYYFEQRLTPSTIYSIVYFCYIPVGHLLVSLLVFGWPEKYLPSLLSNFPIGLTAMAIGSALTAYCDYKDFNNRVEEYIRDNFTFSHMPGRPDEAPGSEFYTSILVLFVTSVWTYVLSVYINAPAKKSDKKEL